MNKTQRILVLMFGSFILILMISFMVPGIRERILWRMDRLWLSVLYKINPPEEILFIPEQNTAGVLTPQVDAFGLPTAIHDTLDSAIIPAGSNTSASTAQWTDIPTQYYTSGYKYFDQHGLWNYCAPANLAMALSYWGWQGDRLDVGRSVKPNDNDMNVMPDELAEYVNQKTPYRAIVRVAGTLELLKQLIAADFPVIVEKGTIIRETSTGQDTWMGHYSYLTGYDDASQSFISQDSYYTADYKVPYTVLMKEWQGFNYVFLVVFPQERSADLMALLGELQAENSSHQIALERATQEISAQTGIQHFFAWYNRGSSLVKLQDYGNAAKAFDAAFQSLAAMPEGEIPKKVMRIVWYETSPYYAYYYTARHTDVINLATQVMGLASSTPYLEESFYWRALSRFALGQNKEAADDLCASLEYHPDYALSLAALNAFGVYSCP
jgi:hypothetical protein